jgi:ZIP family zinc transporter
MELILIIVIISVMGPVIGSAIGVIKKPSGTFLSNMLAFAAGVMLAISFIELIPESIALSSVYIAAAGVALGSVFMHGVDKLIPHIHPELCAQEHGRNLKRTATYLLLGIFMHNFPEGMAMGIGSVSGMEASLVLAIGIAVQNVPEGIATSSPYYRVTRNRLRSFLFSSSTALPLLAGFVFSYYLFQSIPMSTVGLLIGATAGLMIYISSDELIPVSCCQTSDHTTIFSLMAGVVFVTLLGAL